VAQSNAAEEETMKIFVIGDLYGNLGMLESMGAKVAEEDPGLIVFTGDIVAPGARFREWIAAEQENRTPRRDLPEIREQEHEDVRSYHAFFRAIDDLGRFCYVIPGGMDAPLDVYLQIATNRDVVSANAFVVHHRITSKFRYAHTRGFAACGFGGILTEKVTETFFVQMYSRPHALYAVQGFVDYPDPKVLLIHTPPRLMTPKGCEVVDEMIDTLRPSHAFCSPADGEQGDRMVGTTLVVCPGEMRHGHYATVDTMTNEVKYRKLEVGAAYPA